jgi:hypothetical protein
MGRKLCPALLDNKVRASAMENEAVNCAAAAIPRMQIAPPMKLKQIYPAIAASLVLSFAACEKRTVVVVEPSAPQAEPVSKTRTFETAALKSAINSYEQAPSPARAADVRKAFAELDGEIAELEADVAKKTGQDRAEAAQKLANLTGYREAERARFAKLEATTPADTGVDARSAAQKAEDAARKTGTAVKDAAKDVGQALKDITR